MTMTLNKIKKVLASAVIALAPFSSVVAEEQKKDETPITIGASTELGRTGLKLWYQEHLKRKKDLEHAVFVGFGKSF